MHWNRIFLLPWLLLGFFAPTVLGQTPSVQAPTLYEPCAALTSHPAAAAEIKRAVTALKDKEAKPRIEAAQQLSKSCDQRAVEPLIGALKDEDPLVRVAVVEALGQLGDRSAIDPLIEAIQDKDWRVLTALGRSLCSFQKSDASDAALNTLANFLSRPATDANDLRARCMAILAVNQLRDVNFSRKAVYLVFLLLDDEHESYRQIGEETMLELKKTRNGERELVAILKQHNNPVFRQKAAYWLGKLRSEMARGALGEASVSDGDARVRGAAAESLRALGEDKK
jgi:HEAT repeat protein